jgi:hypothetical protein
MLELTETRGGFTVTWSHADDDPRGWVSTAVSLGHMQDALRALGDPMEFANVAADDRQAAEELKSTAWMVTQLTRRMDALIVALKDRGTSWTELARLVEPDEADPSRLRSAMQRRYETGRRRAGLPEGSQS